MIPTIVKDMLVGEDMKAKCIALMRIVAMSFKNWELSGDARVFVPVRGSAGVVCFLSGDESIICLYPGRMRMGEAVSFIELYQGAGVPPLVYWGAEITHVNGVLRCKDFRELKRLIVHVLGCAEVSLV